MASKIKIIVAIGLAIASILTGCGQVKNTSNAKITTNNYPATNDYVMELKLDTGNKTLEGNQKVNYVNNTQVVLKDIYFHVYANSDTFKALGGNMKIESITVNDQTSDFSFECSDKSMIRIRLKESVKPNQRVKIAFNYKIKIPKDMHDGSRYGYDNRDYNLGNFFPIVAVYDENGWDIHPYDKKGDPFYSETSNFDVDIFAPENQVIAASGSINEVNATSGNKEWKIKANYVRDFAFVASDTFKVEESNVDGVTVKAYGNNAANLKSVLQVSTDVIKTFNSKYGKYPYSTCSIVQTDSKSMEYPTLVMIESDVFDSAAESEYSASLLSMDQFTLVHELAHQWWYGLVGNNEYREAWIDESLAQCSSLEYFRTKYGKDKYDEFYNINFNSFSSLFTNYSGVLDKDLSKFDDKEYSVLIYFKGAIMWEKLRENIGDAKFDLVLQTVFKRYEYKVINSNELIKIVSEIAGRDMTKFFHEWLETNYAG